MKTWLRWLLGIVAVAALSVAVFFAGRGRWWGGAEPVALEGGAADSATFEAWRAHLRQTALPTCTEKGRFSTRVFLSPTIVFAGAPCTDAQLLAGDDPESPRLVGVRGAELEDGGRLVLLDFDMAGSGPEPVYRTHVLREWPDGTEGAVGILDQRPQGILVPPRGGMELAFRSTMTLPQDDTMIVAVTNSYRGTAASLTLASRQVQFSTPQGATEDAIDELAHLAQVIGDICRVALTERDLSLAVARLREIEASVGDELYLQARGLVPVYDTAARSFMPFSRYSQAPSPVGAATVAGASVVRDPSSPLTTDPVGSRLAAILEHAAKPATE